MSVTLSDFDIHITSTLSSSLFSITSQPGSLSLSNMDIRPKETSVSISASLLSITTASLTLNSVSISNITASTPLLSLSPSPSSSYSFTTTTFENITRSEGNGTIFEFPSLSTSLTLSNMTFTQCRCIDGYGGVIYASLLPSSTLILSTLTFTSCTASESGGAVSLSIPDSTARVMITSCSVESIQDVNGGFVYIECPDGYELVEQDEWISFINEYAQSQEEKLNWVQETKEGGASGSLLSFKIPLIIHV